MLQYFFIIKQGHTGKRPFTFPHFGHRHDGLPNCPLYDFTNNYYHRRSAEWQPISNAGFFRFEKNDGANEIYLRNMGLIPSYAGHVPGGQFVYGETFGKLSRNAKRVLCERI